MKQIILAAVWLICLANILFFLDIIICYLTGYTKSPFTGATTGQVQVMFSMFMILIILVTLSLYTSVIIKYLKW